MDALKGDTPARTGSFMPPATTRRFPERPPTGPAVRIAPPFLPTGLAAAESQPAQPAEKVEQQSEEKMEQQPAAAVAETESVESEVIEIDLGWETLVEEEGIVEPAFAVDAEAVLRELSEHATALSQQQDFPVETFALPEEPDVAIAKGDEPAAEATASPASSLAERLETLSQRLRTEQADEIVRRLAAGDRLDSLLAGLLAGYLAGKSEQ